MGRFENQGETRRQLEEMKAQNEKQISRLREESERLQSQFEEMKYTGEAKLSRYYYLHVTSGVFTGGPLDHTPIFIFFM